MGTRDSGEETPVRHSPDTNKSKERQRLVWVRIFTVQVALEGLRCGPLRGRARAVHRHGRNPEGVLCSTFQTWVQRSQIQRSEPELSSAFIKTRERDSFNPPWFQSTHVLSRCNTCTDSRRKAGLFQKGSNERRAFLNEQLARGSERLTRAGKKKTFRIWIRSYFKAVCFRKSRFTAGRRLWSSERDEDAR